MVSAGTDRRSAVETAISRVLEAEQQALSDIAACEARAEETRRDARNAVRALVRHTQSRVSQLHAGCAKKTRELVDELEREAAERADRMPSPELEDTLLRAAVARVALLLTCEETVDDG